MQSITEPIFDSLKRAFTLFQYDRIHLRHWRTGKPFRISNRGTYTIFRETENIDGGIEKPITLIVGFKLKLIGKNPILHWVFRRLCILTTPFWCGFKGFGTKLWMYDQHSKNYLGIYKWYGKNNADSYLKNLIRVLRPLSTSKSVWFELNQTPFEDFLFKRTADTISREEIVLPSRAFNRKGVMR